MTCRFGEKICLFMLTSNFITLELSLSSFFKHLAREKSWKGPSYQSISFLVFLLIWGHAIDEEAKSNSSIFFSILRVIVLATSEIYIDLPISCTSHLDSWRSFNNETDNFPMISNLEGFYPWWWLSSRKIIIFW